MTARAGTPHFGLLRDGSAAAGDMIPPMYASSKQDLSSASHRYRSEPMEVTAAQPQTGGVRWNATISRSWAVLWSGFAWPRDRRADTLFGRGRQRNARRTNFEKVNADRCHPVHGGMVRWCSSQRLTKDWCRQRCCTGLYVGLTPKCCP
ncbi:MAG: hypothetical protein ACLSHC_15555 [Bilophila wadsworthia]